MTDPALSPDGRELVFSWGGDLWLAPATGGEATQLTDTEAHESDPAFSPSGAVIAYASDAGGQQDIYIRLRHGSAVKRLTYNSADDARPCFTADGNAVLFQSRRDSNLDLVLNDSLWDLWKIPSGGGTAESVTYFRGQNPAVSPDGRTLAFDRYASGYADGEHDVFLKPLAGGVPHRVAGGRMDARRPQFAGKRLYFINEANGVWHNDNTYNLWYQPAEGGAHTQLTRYRAGRVWDFTIASKAEVAVVERDYRFERVDLRTGDSTPIAITVAENPYVAASALPIERTIRGLPAEMSRAGAGAVVFRLGGDLWRLALADLPATPDTLPAREPEALVRGSGEATWPSVAPDGRWLVATRGSDLLIWPLQKNGRLAPGAKPRVLLTAGGELRNPGMSRDGAAVAVTEMDGMRAAKLLLVEVATGKVRTLADDPQGLELYPQATAAGWFYIVSTRRKRSFVSTLMRRAPDGTTTEIATGHRGLKRHLALSPSGRRAAFTASQARRNAIVVVDLGAPETRAKPLTLGGGDLQYPVWLDETTLVAVAARRDSAALAVFRFDDAGALVRQQRLPLVTRVLQAKGAFMAEIFEACWQTFNRRYYDPNFHGVDWSARGRFYRPLARAAQTTRELYELLSRMILELDSSHVHVEAPYATQTQTGTPAWDLKRVNDKLYVAAVVAGGPADRAGILPGDVVLGVNGAPLTRRTSLDRVFTRPRPPGATAGLDELLKNGGTIPTTPWDPKFTATLDLGRGDDTEALRVTVGLIDRDQLRQLKYDTVIAARRARVEKLSGGRLAYHHVKTMLPADISRFRKALAGNLKGAEGLVLDIRDGVGGNIHQALVALLDSGARDRARGRPGAFIRGRKGGSQADGAGGPYDMMRRFRRMMGGGGGPEVKPWDKPVILIQNHISRSDKEIFPNLFRHLGLGTIVGAETARGVIGSGYVPLADGGRLMISSSVFFTATGVNMEGTGVMPDILVPEVHRDLYRGIDRQLDTAAQVLLAQIDGRLPFPEKRWAGERLPVIPKHPAIDGTKRGATNPGD